MALTPEFLARLGAEPVDKTALRNPLKYSLYTFATREEARQWLKDEGFVPFQPRPGNTVYGLWHCGENTVQAFKNLSGTWTVQRYLTPDPDNFINY